MSASAPRPQRCGLWARAGEVVEAMRQYLNNGPGCVVLMAFGASLMKSTPLHAFMHTHVSGIPVGASFCEGQFSRGRNMRDDLLCNPPPPPAFKHFRVSGFPCTLHVPS